MRRSTFIKALTLLSFVLLITSFLLYRLGKFDSYFISERSSLQTSSNGGEITSNKADTLTPKTDSTQKLMLPSSKSVILTDKKHHLQDTTTKKLKIELDPKKVEIMSSSKSAIMFTPPTEKQLRQILADSMNYDTIKKRRKTKP